MFDHHLMGLYHMGHPAAFPVGLPEFFIKLFTKPGDIVLDPFAGSGTTGLAALSLDRNVVLIDIKKEYCKVAEKRIANITYKNKGANSVNKSSSHLARENIRLTA